MQKPKQARRIVSVLTSLIFMKKLSALGVLAALVLAACQPAAPTEDGPIKLGFIGPLTGDAASYGKDTLNGATLAIDEINAAGGINGRQIELVAEDGRCTGTDAASAAQKLVNVDKVVAILGGQCSGETLAAAPIAEAAKVVMLSALSSSPDVTDAGEYVYRDYPNDALKTKAMAGYFAEKGYANVAIITENTDFASAFRASLKENLPEGAVVFDEVVDPNTKDFRSLMTRLKDVEFDVFFPNGQYTSTIGPMLQQLREQGLEQPAVTHDAGQDKTVIDIAGDASEGLQAINVPAVSDTSDFGQKFIAEFGGAQAAMAFAAHAYDAVGVMAKAIEANGATSQGIKTYFDSMDNYSGVVGNFSFDENGDVVGIPYVLWEVQNGQYVEVADIQVN